jgi:cytochrome b561
MNEAAGVWPFSLRLLHWLSAALVLTALGLGVYMVQLVSDPGARFALTQTHKSLGLAILALTLARLCRRSLASVPAPEPVAPWMQRAARAAHIALYAFLLLMPLSGWLMATTTPVRIPTLVFGLFPLPYPLAPDLATYRFAHTAHVVLAMLLAALIVVHVAAALLHALVWRDRTLARMWRVRRPAGQAAGAMHTQG